ncbi:MAG: TIGR03620 family F420-dependent LLM class oxidoreductase [Thermodesulfobacteriota bacterium]
MDIGKLGVWFFLDTLPAEDAAAFVRRIEGLGYGALWLPEAVGREPFAHIGFLLARSERITLATGIANIWARDAMTMAAAQKTLAEASGGRFLLGIGVSHAPLVEGVRGHAYRKPLSYMRQYLEAMQRAPYLAVAPATPPPTVIAAIRPKMLALAAEMTQGSHTYFVPPEHTARARRILGPDKWLCVAQAVLLESDPTTARAAARQYMRTYVPTLPNYTNNLRDLGYGDQDFADGCSDRLVDDIVAWGDEQKIAARFRAHLAAGATHVCFLPLRSDGVPQADLRAVEAFAPSRFKL